MKLVSLSLFFAYCRAQAAFQCSAEALGTSPDQCAEMSLQCATRLDLTTLSPNCLYNIPDEIIQQLPALSFVQLTRNTGLSPTGSVGLTLAIFQKNPWATNPADNFVARMLQTPSMASNTFGILQSDGKLLARLFTPKTKNLTFSLCRMIPGVTVQFLSDGFFSSIHPSCFKDLQPEMLGSLRANQLQLVPADLFSGITIKQAKGIRLAVIRFLTPDQAANFGPDFVLNPSATPEVNRHKYMAFACSLAPQMLPLNDPAATSQLRAHCPTI